MILAVLAMLRIMTYTIHATRVNLNAVEVITQTKNRLTLHLASGKHLEIPIPNEITEAEVVNLVDTWENLLN